MLFIHFYFEIRQNPHQVLGFGCKGFYNAVALLQLANSDNYCAVFDLHRLGGMPKELEVWFPFTHDDTIDVNIKWHRSNISCFNHWFMNRSQDLLEDRKIWKVGVGPDNDFMKLLRNYGVRMQARLDLRNISRQLMLGNGGTLQNMADKYIAAKLNNRPFRHVDWYARPLPIELINYAADDAIAGIKIFEEFVSYATSIYGPRKEVLRTFEKHVDANFASNLPPWF